MISQRRLPLKNILKSYIFEGENVHLIRSTLMSEEADDERYS